MIELAQLSSDKKIEIRLSPKTFELGEISISPPNAENIVQKAIENIDKNYYSLYGDTIDLNVNFLFFDNPDHRIADFKGQIAVTNNRNNLSAAKYSVAKHAINESFYDYKAEISPNGFYSVLFIKSHAVIRKAKKMKFHFEEIVKYQGNDVYKISFQYNSRYINLSGYMFINMDDYAITYLTYELGECKKWLASTHKSKGMIYTNLEHYRCYTSFVKNDDRYRFSNGSINMLFNQSKKHKILSHNTYNVTVKRIARTTERNGLIFTNVNNLFKKLQ